MTSNDVWLDFEQVRHNIKNNTVDRLKQILSGLNEECATHFPKSGKKQEIIDRIVAILDTWRASNAEDKWIKAKGVAYQVRNTGIYTPNRMPANPSVLPTTVIPHGSYTIAGISKPTSFPQSSVGTGSIGRYDPYAPPRKATTSTAPIASSSTGTKPPVIRFKESPFFQVEQALSAVTECPESTSAADRRQQIVTFTLNNEHISKLKAPGSKYQLRLFCTSSVFYSGPNAFRTNTVACPIEFPPTCEVRVNNVQLTANLKGLKKKPGTAPPPDLGKYVRLTNVQNRVEMVYVNSQQPVQHKKYYLVVMLVEVTSVDRLVSILKTSNYQSSDSIRQKMVDTLSEDDDIVAGPQKMSLKCPLSFMRVNTPCRSSKCVHSQCFDATSWYSVMEQTTTWLCPVCERVLDCKDLIIDGYFDEILKHSPESVEDVIVEADGNWHTADNKYGSADWLALNPPTAKKTPSPAQPPSRSPSKPANSDLNGKPRTKNQEIFVLDSDDEDEGQVKRELSPSFGSGSSMNRSFDGPASFPRRTQSQPEEVIDLTLDSDEEPPQATKQAGKRKAIEADISSTSPTEQIWKKSRPDPDRNLASVHQSSTPRQNSVDYSHQRSPLRPIAPSSPPPLRYATPYQGTPLPTTFSTYPIRGVSSTSSPLQTSLPSIDSILPRANGRWP